VNATFSNYGVNFGKKAYDKGTYDSGNVGLIALTEVNGEGLDATNSLLEVYGFADFTFSDRGGSVVQVAPFNVVGVDVSISDDNIFIAFLQVGETDAQVCIYTYDDTIESWTQVEDCVQGNVQNE